jgi:hypothetical protein
MLAGLPELLHPHAAALVTPLLWSRRCLQGMIIIITPLLWSPTSTSPITPNSTPWLAAAQAAGWLLLSHSENLLKNMSS